MNEAFANVYAYLQQTYPQHQTVYNARISYINCLVDSPGKINFHCLVQKKAHRSPPAASEPVLVPLDTEAKLLDLTGSPLKDECDIDVIDMSDAFQFATTAPWTEAEESYKGVDSHKCHLVLSDFQLQSIGADSNSSLWILCDAKDAENVVLRMVQFNRKYNCRGTVAFRGLKQAKEIDVARLVQAHLRKIKDCFKLDTTIDSYFTIDSGLTLKVATTSTSSNPSVNDFRSSETTLFQTLKVGDTDSAAEDFWRQLCILGYIRDDILEYKRSDESEKRIEYRCGRGIDLEVLQKEVVAALTDFSLVGGLELEEDNCEIEAVVERAKLKNTVDATDKLWEILRRCSSYKDLKAGFNIVFQCSAKCNIVNPPTNDNRLAEIIREVSDRRLAIPCLSGSEPLELLLEIGLEKLIKDYEYIFTESKICMANDLEIRVRYNKKSSASTIGAADTIIHARKSLRTTLKNVAKSEPRMTLLHTNHLAKNEETDLIGFQNSKFNSQEVEYQLSRLAQIHLALEHLLRIQINLNLENVYNEICQRILSQPEQPFDTIKNCTFDSIEVPIVTDSVISRLDRDPNSRRIVMKSQNKFKEVQTTYYYNMENIFPPNTFSTNELDESIRLAQRRMCGWSRNSRPAISLNTLMCHIKNETETVHPHQYSTSNIARLPIEEDVSLSNS